jgi:hypothetical protein
MKNKLLELHTLRLAIHLWKTSVETKQEMLEQTPEFQILKEAKESYMEAKVEADELADAIREDTVKEFHLSKDRNKNPYDGIQIKKFQVNHVIDEKAAKEWAATNAPQVLTIKVAPFNKIAGVLDLDFVQKTHKYRAQIASDLSMYEDTEDD